MDEFDPRKISDLILLKVFSHLPISSLHICILVCKKWNELGQEAISKRKSQALSFLFMSEKWKQFKQSNKRNSSQVISMYDFLTNAKLELSHLNGHPQIVILFLLNHTNSYVLAKQIHSKESSIKNDRLKRKLEKLDSTENEKNLENLQDVLYQLLPAPIKKLEVNCDGIIGTSIGCKNTKELESDYKYGAIAGLILPESENFKFSLKAIDLNHNMPKKLQTEGDLYDWLELKKISQRLKYILIMNNSKLEYRAKIKYLISSLDRIRKSIGLDDEKNFVVSGGIVKSLSNLSDSNLDKNNLTFLLLTERIGHNNQPTERSVDIAQIVMPDIPANMIEIAWNEKIDALKRNKEIFFETRNDNNKNRKMIAFRISCVARGKDYFDGDGNFESSLFNKTFPNTPLVGFFGAGELGLDFVHLNNKKINLKKEDTLLARDESLKYKAYYFESLQQFAYTTIFTIISLGV